MRYVCDHKNDLRNNRDKDIKAIEKYLNEIGIGTSTNILRKFFDILAGIEQDGNVFTTVGILAKFSLVFMGENYDNALNALHSILENNTVLVVIDTLEQYDIRDEQLIIIIRALVQVSNYYSWNFKNDRIFVKYAMPSEIYTQIRPLLPAKLIGHIVLIEWNYKDLVKMIAVKFFCYASTKKEFFTFVDKYSLLGLYYDSQMALNIIYEILPKMCLATIALKFDTLAYCIRHTQKKPRQLMIIIDALIHEVMEEGRVDILKNNPDAVRHVIHSVQEEMLMDSIAMYRDSIPKVLQICCEVLNGRKYTFTAKEFDSYIRQAKKIYKAGLSLDEIKRIIIESGLVGKQETLSYIPEDSKWFENEKVIRILNASFEYQIKGSLNYADNSVMCIHPMCYEFFRCKISRYTMVYPDKDADPYDILNEVFAYID